MFRRTVVEHKITKMEIDKYTKITSNNIDIFLSLVKDFHDSLIKEVHMINSAFVDKEKAMHMDISYNVRLVIQSQYNPIGIELLLIDVREMQFEKLFEIYGGNIEELIENEELFALNLDNEFRITCSKIYYQTKDDWYGNKVFSHGHIPTENTILSTNLDNNWRQCSECNEAWENDSTVKLEKCPKCNSLTELNSIN
jgi:hypothetical protein